MARRGLFGGSQGKRRGLFGGSRGLFGGTGTSTKPPATEAERLKSVTTSNASLQARLEQAQTKLYGERGAAAGTPAVRGLTWTLDQIGRPYYALMGGVKAAVEGEGLAGVGREAWRGLSLQDKPEFGDVLTSAGWNPTTPAGKFAKGAVSLVGGMAFDPANYVTLGAAGVTEQALKTAMKGTLKAAGREVGEGALTALAKELAVVAKVEAKTGRFSSKVAREVATEAADRLGDATLRGPIEEALFRAKPAQALRYGTSIPFTGKKVQASASLARPAEALEAGLAKARKATGALTAALGRTAPIQALAKTSAGKAGGRLLEALSAVPGKTREVLGRTFVVDYGHAERLKAIGRPYRDVARADSRQILDDATNLARDFEKTLKTASPEALRPSSAFVSASVMRGLHGAGKGVGLDHEGLRALATELFGVDSLKAVSDEQARALRAVLRHPDFGSAPAKDLIPKTLETVAEEMTPSYAVMRAVDSGEIDTLPEALKPYATEAKAAFDAMGAAEESRGILKAARENYFPHILIGYDRGNRASLDAAMSSWSRKAGKLSKTHKFARERTLDSFDDLEAFVRWAREAVPGMKALAIEKDWVKVLAIRKLAHSKAMRNWDMLESLRAMGDDLVTDAATAPDYFVEPPIPQLSGVKVAPDVARWLNDFKEPFTNITSLRKFLELVDGTTNVWKGLATAARPGFHIRNAVSNMFNNWLAGVKDPIWYVDSLRLQRAAGKGEDALRALTIRGQNGYDLWRGAVEAGVVGQGWMGADVGRSLEAALRAGRQGTRGRLLDALHPVQTGRRVGTAVEDNARVAHYLFKRAEGLDPELAALSVKRYLFDYDELTATERNVLRRFWLFYTWSRKNIPLQLSELLKQPGTFGKLGHLKRTVEALSTGPGDEDLPEWLRKSFTIRLPWQTARGQLYANIDLPLTDLVLPGPREILSMLTPLLRAPAELITNQQFYSGQEIERSPGEYVEAPGYLWALDKMASPLPGWTELRKRLGLAEIVNAETGERELRMPARARYLADQLVFLKDVGRLGALFGGPGTPEKLASPFLGVGLSALTPEKLALDAAYEERRRLQGQRTTLESRGAEIPEAEKAPTRATRSIFPSKSRTGRRGLFGGK
jgi:hypothetical protein